MTTNIQLLRSSIAYKRPSAAPLLDGQAAINLNSAEPGLFWRLTNGQLAKAGPVAITDNGMEPNSAPAGETGNSVGEEWLDAHPALYSPILHIYNGTEFVTANGFTVDKSTGNLTLLRQLEVTKLIAGEIQCNGNMILTGNLTPGGQNCAFYIGLPDERWDYFYGCNFDVKFDGNVSRHLTVGEDLTIGHYLIVEQFVASNLIPEVDSTRHLGRSDKRWIAWLSALNVEGNMQLGSKCADILTVNATANFKCKTTFENDVEFQGDVKLPIIGTSCSETLTVIATSTFKCPVTFEKEVVLDTIGQGCGDTLTVNATTTFKCAVDFEQPITINQIGNNCSDTLVVNASTTFKCPVTFEQPIKIDQIGNSCSESLIINATTTFKCPVTFESDVNFNVSLEDLVAKGDIVLGDGCTSSNVNLNGAVTLSCDMLPNANNARTIGANGNRLKAVYATDVYTGDLHLKNEKGDWTMIEAEEYLTIRNNKTGKVFRLMMEEV